MEGSSLVLEELGESAAGTAELIYSHRRGVISLSGALAPLTREMATFTIESEQRLEQRREGFRVVVSCPAKVTRADGTVLEARTADLSVRGARFICAAVPEAGEPLRISLMIGERLIALTGTAVRLEDNAFTVHFDDMKPVVDDQISRFLMAEQRRKVRTNL